MYTPHFFSKIQMLLGPNLAHLLSAQDQGDCVGNKEKFVHTLCAIKQSLHQIVQMGTFSALASEANCEPSNSPRRLSG